MRIRCMNHDQKLKIKCDFNRLWHYLRTFANGVTIFKSKLQTMHMCIYKWIDWKFPTSRWFSKTVLILFLDVEGFYDKIQKIPLSVCFESYHGGKDRATGLYKKKKKMSVSIISGCHWYCSKGFCEQWIPVEKPWTCSLSLRMSISDCKLELCLWFV